MMLCLALLGVLALAASPTQVCLPSTSASCLLLLACCTDVDTTQRAALAGAPVPLSQAAAPERVPPGCAAQGRELRQARRLQQGDDDQTFGNYRALSIEVFERDSRPLPQRRRWVPAAPAPAVACPAPRPAAAGQGPDTRNRAQPRCAWATGSTTTAAWIATGATTGCAGPQLHGCAIQCMSTLAPVPH